MSPPLVAGYVVVSFHAHPDDEALLTAGTLARAVADGHRVVLVVATAGESGLAATDLPGELLPRRPPARRADRLGARDRLRAGRPARLRRLRSGRYGERRPPTLRARRRRGGRAAARRGARRGVGRRADDVRPGRWLRTSRPRAGAPGGRAGRGPRGHAGCARSHRGPHEPAAAHSSPARHPVGPPRALHPAGGPCLHRAPRPHAQGEHPRPGRRQASGDGRPCKPVHGPSGRTHAGVDPQAPRPLYRHAFRHEWFVERGRLPSKPPIGDIFATLRAGGSGPGNVRRQTGG